MLFKKLLRTMGQYKAQFISMIIMIALGFGVFIGANMEWVSIEKNTNRLFEETGLADYKIYSSSALAGETAAGFTEEELEKVQSISGVKAAARFFSVNADVRAVNGDKIKTETDESGKVELASLKAGNHVISASVEGSAIVPPVALVGVTDVPKTGDMTFIPFVITFIALMFAGTAVAVGRRRSRED